MSSVEAASTVGEAAMQQAGQAIQASQALQAMQAAAMFAATAPQPDWGAWPSQPLTAHLAVKAELYEGLDNIGRGADEDMPVWDHRQILERASHRQLMVEQTVMLRLSLQKLRQIEKQSYHQEGRQDAGTGLASDQDRHVEQYKAEMAAARQVRDEGSQAVIASKYKTARRDWMLKAASQSCFAFCEAWWRLPRKL